ncbi:MAG: hypothetical protein J6O61_12035 [Butyrivibrio sp.]|uniref:hypothetical protein n=1 Tax=Butyrivibrio sp. TaxID=28121 RepID=UPI001B011F4E|nr:hypothetical protein [Butyrivibrio sp.]MBO6241546.1 hypothetical protein [Butyrivibrio sp.]
MDIKLSDFDPDLMIYEEEPGYYSLNTTNRRNKLGNLLKTGLINEIGSPNNSSTAAIREAVSYLYLWDYISADCYDSLRLFWESEGMPHKRSILDRFNDFSGVLLDELLEKFEVENFEELVEKLNCFTIPDWIGISLLWLDDILPEGHLLGDTLYFLGDRKDGGCRDLLSICVNNIRNSYDITDSISFIGSDFTGFLGVSRPDLLYLRSSEPGRFYIYNSKTDNFEIIRGDFRFSLGASTAITTEGGNLMVRSIHGTSLICKTGDYESYEKAGSFIKVIPDMKATGFFQPYYLDIYGGRNEASDEEKRRFLWDFLTFSSGPVGEDDGIGPLPEKMNVRYLMESLNETFSPFDRCNSDYLINLESLLMFMKSLLSEEHDLMDILYVLADIDRKLTAPKRNFPSDDLLENLGVLRRNEKRELKESLLNIGKQESVEYLRKALLSDSYDTFYGEGKDKSDGLIGAFTCRGDALKVLTKHVEEGMYIGDLSIMPVIDGAVHGTVSYDARNDSFIVTSKEELAEIQRCRIVEAFNLQNSRKMFLVDEI